MRIILFFLANLLVIISSYLINYRILKPLNLVNSLISWFLLYLSQIILSEMLLGLLGVLYFGNLIILQLLILVVVFLLTNKSKSSIFWNSLTLPVREVSQKKILLFLLSVIFCFALAKIIVNLFNPPFGWDNLNYHFPFAIEWLKYGNLSIPPTIFDDPSPSYYPINGSLFYLWLIMPLRNLFLADLGQVPFFILALLAVFALARKLGLGRVHSFYAAALFLLIPNFFKQLQVAYVDVMVAGLFLVCVNYLLELNKNFNWINTLVYSLSLGLLIGTKTTALPYGVLLFIPFLYLIIKDLKKGYFLILSLLIIVVLGGFTYIRNFIEAGNPLYPLDLVIAGKSIFKGVIGSAIYKAHVSIDAYSISKTLFHEGLGLQTLLLVLPGIFLTLPLAILKKEKNLSPIQGYIFILPLLIYFVYRYLIPLANLRYLYSILGMGIVFGLLFLKKIDIPKSLINALVVICAIASMAELAKRQELIVALILTFFTFIGLLLFVNKIKLAFLLKRSTILISLALTILFLILGQAWYLKNEFPRYLKMAKYSGFWPDAAVAWDWFNNHTAGNNIAYAGRPVPLPLYGSQFKNNVYYLSVNKIEPAKLHNFPDSRYEWGSDYESEHKNFEVDGNYRGRADYKTWLNNLTVKNTDYLFIYSLHQIKGIEFPLEDSWAKANPGKFSAVFLNETIHIYKVLK